MEENRRINLLLNSQDTTATKNNNNVDITFDVTLLSTYLKDTTTKYYLEFTFKSEPVILATGLPEVGQVIINNFLLFDNITGNSKTTCIGCVYPSIDLIGANTYLTYQATSQDNKPVVVNYPYNSSVNVRLRNLANTAVLGSSNTNIFPNYLLTISLIPFI